MPKQESTLGKSIKLLFLSIIMSVLPITENKGRSIFALSQLQGCLPKNCVFMSIKTVILLAFLANICLGQGDLGNFQSYSSPDGYYMVLLQENWNVNGFKCAGMTAQDTANPARGIVYLSRLHEGFDILPSGVTPESYLEDYMAEDFSAGSSSVKDVQIKGYEDAGFYQNQDMVLLLSGLPFTSTPTSAKALRCSFTIDGIPVEGSFVIKTRELFGYGTIIDYFLGIYAPSDQFDQEAPSLLESFNSVQLNPQYRNICIPPSGGCTRCLDNDCCSHDCDMHGNCD